MKKRETKSLIENVFIKHLTNFKIHSVDVSNFGFYSKLLSEKVGIYITYEFRELIPQIQFTLLENIDFQVRKGWYTLIELYKLPGYILKSFYMNEILSERGLIYQDFFNKTNSIEQNLEVSVGLIEKYGHDFLNGNDSSYVSMDNWFRRKLVTNQQV